MRNRMMRAWVMGWLLGAAFVGCAGSEDANERDRTEIAREIYAGQTAAVADQVAERTRVAGESYASQTAAASSVAQASATATLPPPAPVQASLTVPAMVTVPPQVVEGAEEPTASPTLPPLPSPTRTLSPSPTPTLRPPPSPTPTFRPPPSPTPTFPPLPSPTPTLRPPAHPPPSRTVIPSPTFPRLPTPTPSATPSPVAPTSPPVLLSGRLEIDQTWMADLDAGKVEAGAATDIWFEAVTAMDRYVTPRNGATIASVGVRPVGYAGCQAARLTAERIPIGSLPAGSCVCVRTNQGHYAEFRVSAAVGPSPGVLIIDYRTW